MNIGVIPARLNSKRFPKKILKEINGKPMVIHTAEKVSKSKSLDKIIIAIDSDETYEVIKDYGFEIIMTSDTHKSGTDRVAEVVKKIDDVDIVINIQADEPFIDSKLIDELIESFKDNGVEMSTLISTQLYDDDMKDENIVKASLDSNNFAIDFSRNYGMYKHLGIYAFTPETLIKFISYPQTDSEKNRKLEQMRALDNGIKIKAVLTDGDSLSINSEKDMELV